MESRRVDPRVTVILAKLVEQIHGKAMAARLRDDVPALIEELRVARRSGTLLRAAESDLWVASFRNELQRLSKEDAEIDELLR